MPIFNINLIRKCQILVHNTWILRGRAIILFHNCMLQTFLSKFWAWLQVFSGGKFKTAHLTTGVCSTKFVSLVFLIWYSKKGMTILPSIDWYFIFQTKYGKRIIVRRTISATSGSKYELRNEKGKRVSPYNGIKEELDKILRHLNIDISNPIALMSQDMAKSFLFKCEPDKLYQFFMKSTSLEESRRLIHESEQEIKYSKGNNWLYATKWRYSLLNLVLWSLSIELLSFFWPLMKDENKLVRWL